MFGMNVLSKVSELLFQVEPYSIAHDSSRITQGTSSGRSLSTCGFLEMEHPSAAEQPPPQGLESDGAEIVWTYDVKWELSDVRWAGRWDMYMMSSSSDTVHWFSIINSLVLVLVLAFVVRAPDLLEYLVLLFTAYLFYRLQ